MVAGDINLENYKNAKRGPKKKPPPKGKYQNGGHVSTHKALLEYKQRKAKC